MLGLLLQGCQLLVAVADVVELLLEVLSDFYQGIDVLYMELLLQRVDGVEPAVDLVESCRFEVDAVDVGAYLLSDVLQFDVAAVEPFGSLCYGGIDFLDGCELLAGGLQPFEYASVLIGQRVVGFVEGSLDVLGMSQRLGFLLQRFLLAFL